MSIALVQHTTKDLSTAATSTTLAYGSNPTANNLLVAVVRGGSGLTSITITDSLGNSWTNCTFHAVGGTASLQISFAVNGSTAADTVTITPNASSTLRIGIYEYSGTATANPLDVENNTQSGSSTAPASSSITPASANELIFAAYATGNNVDNSNSTAGASFALRDHIGTNGIVGTEDWFQTTATATTGPFTLGISDTWMAAIAAFKAAGAVLPAFEDDTFNANLVQYLEPIVSVW